MQKPAFPWRAIILGALLSVLVALYSSYAGLKVGGVYWPMVTTAVVSLALMRALGGRDKNEANVMQTAASTGGLLAAGVIFTIPALFMLGLEVSATDILLVSLTGGLLGLLFVYPLRQRMVVEEKLPYADGAAAAAIISAGDKGGKQSKVLIGSFGVGAVFAAANTVLLLPLSLISIAGGFLIGVRFTLAWFIGSLATLFFVAPYFGAGLAQPLGVGIVIGAAIAYFIVAGIPVFLKVAQYYQKAKMGKWGGIAILLLCLVLVYAFNLSLPLALIAIVGAFLMAFIGARITGEMNVDPMEIFALIALIAAKFLFGFGVTQLVLVAAVVCIAAGIAGDAMQDFKTGFLLGTPPEHQLFAEAAGVITASLVMGVLMLSFASVGFGTSEFPAPQAIAVKQIVQSGDISTALLAGAAIGFVFTILSWKMGLGAVAIAFGIGLYVPFMLSLLMVIGGIARFAADRAKQTEKWRLAAGGVIAGEGLVGAIIVLLAAAKFFGF
ncbi:MAG: OPT/YSL family transporter [Candidatus Micrarchaeia archaeon]